jgi:Plavaka transposase
MISGQGITYHAHPLLACIIGDYPEHVLTTCIFTGKCPTCPVEHDQLGEYNAQDGPALYELIAVMEALDSFNNDPASFLQACKNVGIRPVFKPYWKDLSYSHINHSVMLDILHQMY